MRRAQWLVVLLTLGGGALALVASSRTWWMVETPRVDPLPPLVESVTGRDYAPWLWPAAFITLAGGLALCAVRRWGVVVLATITAGAGLTLTFSSYGAFSPPQEVHGIQWTWPLQVLAAGAFVTICSVAAVVSFRRWEPLMGARFERGRRSHPAADETDIRKDVRRQPSSTQLWDSLDAGEDPTR